MTLALPKDKIEKLSAVQRIDKQSSNCSNRISTNIMEAILFCRGCWGLLHQRYLQQFQILALKELSYQSKITLDNKFLEELKYGGERI